MILVAVGANLPAADGVGSLENCVRALALLAEAGVAAVDRSRWYRSPPWPRSDQPDYTNAVVRVDAAGPPESLLERLHAVEARMGRVRGARNAARVIDLDLIAFGRLIRGADGEGGSAAIRLPHPRLQDRAFVLFPLRDVAPGWIHPVSGRSVDEMIADLPGDHECVAIGAAPGAIRGNR